MDLYKGHSSVRVTLGRQGLSVQTRHSAALNSKHPHSRLMYQGLAFSLDGLAAWLQSASERVPISQLSLMVWAMFVLSVTFARKSPFNSTEQ